MIHWDKNIKTIKYYHWIPLYIIVATSGNDANNQWPFQEPIYWRYLPYMFGLLFRPKFQGISPEKNGLKYGTFTYLHLLDPEDLPLIIYNPFTSWFTM